MNATKICNVLLAMVLTGGLMSHGQVSSAQTDASSVGTTDATTKLDESDNFGACKRQSVDEPGPAQNGANGRCAKAPSVFEQGKAIFRFDTFGDEDYWGGKLRCTRRSRAPLSEASAPVSARRRLLPSPA